MEIAASRLRVERVQGAPVSDEEILLDMQHAARSAGTSVLSQRLYSEFGRYDATTCSRRFGSWNRAVTAAGLEIANEVNIPDERLFENLMLLWEHYGRQPRRAELAEPPSRVSWGAYRRRFGSWMDGLTQFVAYANSREAGTPIQAKATGGHITSRDPSLRMRFRVLKRNNFSCRACGASPPLTPGLQLHVDHIKAWSAGGETVEGNLQTLCDRCNLGKSNVL